VIYLIDTTVLIDISLQAPEARQLFEQLFGQPNTLLVCDVVVAEALSSGTDDELAIVRNLIGALEYVATDPGAAAWAGERRRTAGKTSPRTLGDALIAGVAWSNQATVVTRNPDDFIAQEIPVLTYG
jgi:predicted nucleic acid-binding protein